MNIPFSPCAVLQFIRNERRLAVSRMERGEVMRRDHEEKEHLDKCVQCASIDSLYLQLWKDAKLGVDLYDEINRSL